MSREVREEIQQITAKLEERFHKERNRQVQALLKKRFGVSTLDYTETTLVVNTMEIRDIKIDEYNNMFCRFTQPVLKDVEELVSMRHVLMCLFERNIYPGRCGRNLFIRYFQQFSKKLSKAQVQKLIDLDGEFPQDRGDWTFYDWLKQELSYGGHRWKIDQFRPWKELACTPK